MSSADVVIVTLVVVAFAFAFHHAIQVFSGKKSCCGGGGGDSDSRFPEAHIGDTDESHYPYTETVKIRGMHCENCARNVTNALDSVKGTWATVDLKDGSAYIRSKSPIDKDYYRDAVKQAGYRLA